MRGDDIGTGNSEVDVQKRFTDAALNGGFEDGRHIETEFKLQVFNAADLEAIRKYFEKRGLIIGDYSDQLISCFYDDPLLRMAKKGVYLRVRGRRRRDPETGLMQMANEQICLKNKGVVLGDMRLRDEVENHLESPSVIDFGLLFSANPEVSRDYFSLIDFRMEDIKEHFQAKVNRRCLKLMLFVAPDEVDGKRTIKTPEQLREMSGFSLTNEDFYSSEGVVDIDGHKWVRVVAEYNLDACKYYKATQDMDIDLEFSEDYEAEFEILTAGRPCPYDQNKNRTVSTLTTSAFAQEQDLLAVQRALKELSKEAVRTNPENIFKPSADLYRVNPVGKAERGMSAYIKSANGTAVKVAENPLTFMGTPVEFRFDYKRWLPERVCESSEHTASTQPAVNDDDFSIGKQAVAGATYGDQWHVSYPETPPSAKPAG